MHCPAGEELRVDNDKAENMPLNSDQPIFLAAGIFSDTMLEMGCPDEDAELAKVAFYSLHSKLEEERRSSGVVALDNKFSGQLSRIRSKVSMSSILDM